MYIRNGDNKKLIDLEVTIIGDDLSTNNHGVFERGETRKITNPVEGIINVQEVIVTPKIKINGETIACVENRLLLDNIQMC